MKMILLCGLLMLAACSSTLQPIPDTAPPRPTCDQGGPCGENERPN